MTSAPQRGGSLLRRTVLAGAAAGVLGAIAVAAAASPLEGSTVAAILPSTSIGLIGGLLFAAALGVGFSLLISRQRRGPGEALFWGVSYGFLVWVVFSLTLWPLINYQRFSWDLPAAQAALPTLFASLLFGALMALIHAVLTAPSLRSTRPPWRSMLMGLIAGLIAIWLLRLLLSTQADQMVAQAMMPQAMQTADPRLLLYLVGVLAGVILALLYPGGFTGVGEGLIRGGLYGFVWWVLGARTLFPILTGGQPEWTLEAVRSDFAALPGYLLFGAVMALLYQWFNRGLRLLFDDDYGDPDQEGVGTQGLKALGRGAVAGLAGGLIFTVVMVQIGFLPNVASLVGSTSSITGLIVHLAIAVLIGMSYGLLFRQHSYDFGSALGWGISYGFVWWVLGALTLMPILQGEPPSWSAEAAVAAFPALIGHILYGAGLGLTMLALEARDRPWWVPRSTARAERVEKQKQLILGSAPALWVLVGLIALTLPVLLAP